MTACTGVAGVNRRNDDCSAPTDFNLCATEREYSIETARSSLTSTIRCVRRLSCRGRQALKYLVVDVFPGGRPKHEPNWHSHAAAVAQWLGGPLRKKGRGFSLV